LLNEEIQNVHIKTKENVVNEKNQLLMEKYQLIKEKEFVDYEITVIKLKIEE